MSLGHGILGFLSYGPMTGYDLAKVFASSVNFFWHAQTSQIYLELGNLEKKGLVSSEQVLQTDKPNKKLFSVTEAGKEELLRWLREDKDAADASKDYKSAFLMRIFFSGDEPEERTVQLLQAFSDQSGARMEQLRAVSQQLKEFADAQDNALQDVKRTACQALTADFGLRFMEMCSQWAQDSIRILRTLEKTESDTKG